MQTVLFILGTLVIQGGLVLLLMWLLTAGDREARREEARRRLELAEGERDKVRKAA